MWGNIVPKGQPHERIFYLKRPKKVFASKSRNGPIFPWSTLSGTQKNQQPLEDPLRRSKEDLEQGRTYQPTTSAFGGSLSLGK
jgi:hypothetical protein